jgi:hypothetical protein
LFSSALAKESSQIAIPEKYAVDRRTDGSLQSPHCRNQSLRCS